MPITYARYVHRKPQPDAIPAIFEELEENTILLLDPVLEATQHSIGELYRRLDLGLRASEIIVFRGARPDLIDAIQADTLLPDNLHGKKVLALVGESPGPGRGPQLLPIPKFDAPNKSPRIESLRQAELLGIFRRADAVFSSDEYHYELPSGLHADKFVRLGDALRSVFDVSRMGDWVLGHLRGNTVIVADTGSLLPLLIDIRERAAARFKWNIEISTLDRYPQDMVAVSDAIAAVCNRPAVVEAIANDQSLDFLFLISVNSSGRLCRLFRNLGPPQSRIVVMCETSGVPTDCDDTLVAVPVEQWPPGVDGRCAQCDNSPVIHVHPESYELLPSIKRQAVVVSKQLAEEKAEFWSMADSADAVQLHVDVPYTVGSQEDFRHFGVYLNTAKLAEFGPFRERCLRELTTIDSPELILIPEHQSSEMVARLCHSAHPRSRICVVRPGRFSADIHEFVAQSKRVLVADDAIVSGTTLVNLRAELFRVTQQLGISPEVNAFVVISRPPDEEPLRALKRRYSGNSVNKILAGAHIYLPEGRHCPWCREHRLLTAFRSKLQGVDLSRAQERIKKLEAPVAAPLLMVAASDAHKDLRTLGSFFGTLRQPAAFAAGVCASQSLVQQLSTFGGGIQSKVIDLGMAVDSYYEGVLLSSLLRTFNAVHVRYPGSDPRVEAALSRIDPVRAYPGVLSELALAALDNKIPYAKVRELLERRRSDDRWHAMFATLVDMVFPRQS